MNLTNTVLCYYAANLEYEKSMEYLMTCLEEEGVLENTVIVITGDHYPYALHAYEKHLTEDIDDVLGKYKDFCPKFAKKYADLNSVIGNAVGSYIEEVKNGSFPADEHIFTMNSEEKVKIEYASSN